MDQARVHLDELAREVYYNFLVYGHRFLDRDIVVENAEYYKSFILPEDEEFIIIGDVHGCFDELEQLISFARLTASKSAKLIFVGDIVDKGPQIDETIAFVHDRVFNHGDHFVRGNHENFVYNYLKGVKGYDQTPVEVVQGYFDSVYSLKGEILEKFNQLVERSTEFLRNSYLIVTHAPTATFNMGKFHPRMLKAQRDWKYGRMEEGQTDESFMDAVESELAFFREQADDNLPVHVVGHVMLKNVMNYKNKYMIDTGCVGGGRLTALALDNQKRVRILSVKSQQPDSGEVLPLFTRETINGNSN
jgi:hypothetical protein